MKQARLLRATTLLGAATLSALLLGCSSSEAGDSGGKKFSGPWAAEFKEFYSQAKDEMVRKILADGKISELEFSEIWTKYTNCLAGSGVHITKVNFDGSTETTFDEGVEPDTAHEAEKECSESSGEFPVATLYHWMRGNPENADKNTLVATCVVERGLAPEGYSDRDLEQDLAKSGYPDYVETAEDVKMFEECEVDPLGLQTRLPE